MPPHARRAFSRRRVLFEAVGRLRHGGGTSLYNALAVVIDQRLALARACPASALHTSSPALADARC